MLYEETNTHLHEDFSGMASLFKVDDNHVGIKASPEEWVNLKRMVLFAAQNYRKTELEYELIKERDVVRLSNQIQLLNSPPEKIEKEQAQIFSCILGCFDICSIEDLSKEDQMELLQEIRAFSFRENFPSDAPKQSASLQQFLQKMKLGM